MVAAECCYGGMLYDPAEAKGVAGFVDAYLGAGVYGYCASTNTSYGPSDHNNMADLICRFFLEHVLSGCSLGRAMLQARQDYVFTRSTLNPVDLKTLAQFNLYGDPSLHPVARAVKTPLPSVSAAGQAGPKSSPPSAAQRPKGIAARRRRLQANGRGLDQTTTHAAAQPRNLAEGEKGRLVASLAVRGHVSAPSATPVARSGKGAVVVCSFEVLPAPSATPGPGEQFHVLLQRRAKGLHAIVAREEAGRIEQVILLRER